MSGERDLDALIGRLAEDAKPVARLRPPAMRAVLWLGAALAAMAGLVAYHGMRPDLMATLAEPGEMMSLAAAAATGVAATFAAFFLAVPGYSSRWSLLPLPVAVVWVSGLGIGCYSDWVRFGPEGISLGDSYDCFQAIVLTSLVLGVPLAYLLRYAQPVRPVMTAAMGGLALSSLAAAALQLFHRTDARIMDVVWHVAAVSLVVALSSGWGAASAARLKG
jgi:hypothetical protein